MADSRNQSNTLRINEVERKIVDLTEAATLVARIDERYKALELRHDNLADNFQRLEKKVERLEDAVQENTRVIMTITKLFWVIVVAASTALAAQFFA